MRDESSGLETRLTPLAKELEAHLDKEYLDQVVQRLGDLHLPIDEASYDEQAFGSWFVTLATSPRMRLVWDGRDEWLYVQQDTGRTDRWGLGIWSDQWSSDGAYAGAPVDAVGELLAVVNECQSPG